MFFLIVGLGNPGEAYRASRHNVGFEAVDRLAARYGIGFTGGRFASELGLGEIEDRRVRLLKPQTHMNNSGEAVETACRFYRVPAERLAVLHDDIDLELGRIQVRRGGGDGGHRGVRSVIEHLGATDFVRFRLGVGRPAASDMAVDHVLSGFAPADHERVDALLDGAAEATAAWLSGGLTIAMNRFNPW